MAIEVADAVRTRLTALAPLAASCGMRDIVVTDDALAALLLHLSSLSAQHPIGSVVVVQDRTEILRDREPLKPAVHAALDRAGYDVRVVVLPDDEPHTTVPNIDLVGHALRPGTCVVALGSGTVADVAKHAVFEYETAHPGESSALVCVQTANSVCAYTSGLAVVTYDRVKRTIPSRLPDALILDSTILDQAPRDYTFGGIGDASVAGISFADYRLASLLGLGAWEPRSWEIMRGPRADFLGCHPALQEPGPTQALTLALDLAATGFSMTVAGESAPVSGLEHVTSHMLDMAADADERPVGNHGCQCALAAVLSSIAFQRLLALDELTVADPTTVDRDAERAAVMEAFAGIDTTGQAAAECWSDYETKLQTWARRSDRIAAFAADWPRHREDLRQYVVDPTDLVRALAVTGHPLRWADLSTPISADRARWAFANARLMRKRTTVADLLAFAGQWDDDTIDSIFTTFTDIVTSTTGQLAGVAKEPL